VHTIEIQHSLSALLCGNLVEVLIMKSLRSGFLEAFLTQLWVRLRTSNSSVRKHMLIVSVQCFVRHERAAKPLGRIPQSPGHFVVKKISRYLVNRDYDTLVSAVSSCKRTEEPRGKNRIVREVDPLDDTSPTCSDVKVSAKRTR
jgi:hypothetical protein